MSLKVKILATVFAIAAFGFLAEYFIFNNIIFDGCTQLERSNAASDMDRIRNALDNENLHLDVILHNISSSDALYRFASVQDKSSFATYFSWEALRAAQVNLVALYDASDRLLQGAAFDLGSREQLHLRLFDKDQPASANPLVLAHGALTPVKGLLMTEAGPMLVAARPVLNTQGWGPSRGTLVMGRLLDEALLSALREKLHLSFSVSPLPTVPPDKASGKPGAARPAPLAMNPLDDNTLVVTATQADILGRPALTLRLDYPRSITRMGRELLQYVAWAFVGLSALMAGGLLFFTQRMVVSPLLRFARHVTGLGDNPETSRPFLIKGNDEIGQAVTAVNDLLAGRRLAVSQLKENQALLRAMLAGIPLDFWARDRDMRCIMQSNISIRHWGNLVGKPLALQSQDAWMRQADHILSGETLARDVSLTTRDGRTRIFHQTVAPILGEGRLEGILGINIDITEERRREEELRQAKQAAEDANRSKSEFLANMSHEIRTPLNTVLGMLQLASLSPLDPTLREYVETALASGRGLLAVIGDILDLSKIEAGKLELEDRPFSLAETMAVLRAAFWPQTVKKGLRLDIALAPDVPLVVRGDAGRLRQILFNLMGNALKFTDAGGVRVDVAAKALPGPQNAHRFRFLVTDTGIGIAPDKLEEIFKPFVQVDGSYKRNRSGSGLGLAIVRRLTELMGGRIDVESEVGAGTTFACELVLRQASAAEQEQLRQEAERAALESQQSLRLLLVEDEAVNRIMASKLIEKLGHAVQSAANGQEALALLQREDFDCVLMDVQMPDLDGLETTRLIRTSDTLGAKRAIPVVALTAHAMKGDREKCLDAGMDDYLAKPLELEALKTVLSRIGRFDAPQEAGAAVNN